MRRFPAYPDRPHRSGQARIRIDGRDVYLGVHGSPESWAEYQRLLAAWRAGEPIGRETTAAPVRLVRDLVGRYLLWAERHYTDRDGTVRNELRNVRFALRPLLILHGHTPLGDFGPRALKGLLQTAAAGTYEGNRGPWSRRFANANLARWKGVWRWAESEELVPPGTYHQMQTVRGLQPGQALEREEVPPVPEADYAAAVPHLGPVVRQAVELLALTGARPSELLALVPGAIDRGGVVELARGYRVQLPAGVWVVQPGKHKTARKGKRRVILFGPTAQAVLAPLLEGLESDQPIFSPRRAREARWAAARASRKSRVQPSQVARSRPGARQPAERYTVEALRLAIGRACDKAGVPHFSGYQLRHLAATRLAKEYGPAVAGAILGHEHAATTAVYALPDLQAAARAMGEAG